MKSAKCVSLYITCDLTKSAGICIECSPRAYKLQFYSSTMNWDTKERRTWSFIPILSFLGSSVDLVCVDIINILEQYKITFVKVLQDVIQNMDKTLKNLIYMIQGISKKKVPDKRFKKYAIKKRLFRAKKRFIYRYGPLKSHFGGIFLKLNFSSSNYLRIWSTPFSFARRFSGKLFIRLVTLGWLCSNVPDVPPSTVWRNPSNPSGIVIEWSAKSWASSLFIDSILMTAV